MGVSSAYFLRHLKELYYEENDAVRKKFWMLRGCCSSDVMKD